MQFSPLIDQLINSLRTLPSVGPRTAQRMAFHILQHNRDNGLLLAKTLEKAITEIGQCQRCQTLCETQFCQICEATQRNNKLLCIVESPSDVHAIEQTGIYKGYYFVLMGHLSPLDGIGPNELGLEKLPAQLEEFPIEEIIIATNPTVEGEATAHYIAELFKNYSVKITRIAHGVPLGGELEYIDTGTLSKAMSARDKIAE